MKKKRENIPIQVPFSSGYLNSLHLFTHFPISRYFSIYFLFIFIYLFYFFEKKKRKKEKKKKENEPEVLL